MKFCHIEESGGQQVLFHIKPDNRRWSVIMTSIRPEGDGGYLEKWFDTHYEAFTHFETLDFKKEAYNFLTEIASVR